MMKLIRGSGAALVVSAMIFGGSLTPANASVLYEHNDYSGVSYGADSSGWVDWFNDRASSIRNFGYYTSYLDGVSYTGWGFATMNDPRALDWYVPGFGTWNDKISSYRRG